MQRSILGSMWGQLAPRGLEKGEFNFVGPTGRCSSSTFLNILNKLTLPGENNLSKIQYANLSLSLDIPGWNLSKLFVLHLKTRSPPAPHTTLELEPSSPAS